MTDRQARVLPSVDVLDVDPTGTVTDGVPDRARATWLFTMVEHVGGAILVLAVAAEVVVTLISVIARAVGGTPLQWGNASGAVMLNIVAFIGAAIAYRRRQYLVIDWLDKLLPTRGKEIACGAREAIVLVIACVLAKVGLAFATGAYDDIDPTMHISVFWVNLPLAIGMVMIALFSLERCLAMRGAELVGIGLGVVIAVGYFLAESSVSGDMNQGQAAATMGVLTIVLLVCGFSLPFVFLTGAIVYVHVSDLFLSVVASDLLDSSSNFVLVAIPFFLVTGMLMSENLTDRLTDAIRVLLGRLPGSLLHVIVFSMFVFSGISGSKIGDMAAVGNSAVKMAKHEKYPVAEAVAVLAAGAAMGDTIPPSIALIVLSSISFLSVSALFLAGLMPAVVVGLCLLVIIWIKHRGKKVPPLEMSGAQRVRTVLGAFPALSVAVLLVGGIVTGIATPTEISAVAVAYGLILVLAYRKTSLGDIYRIVVGAAVLAGVVLFVTATSTLFARALTIAQVPQHLAAYVSGGHLIGGQLGFLILSTLVLVVMGMVMEGLPAILVFAPLLVPAAISLQINPIEYGILVVMAIGLGANCPPIGVGVYVGAQIGGVGLGDVGRRLIPYLAAVVVGIAIVIALPNVVLWLPRLFHLA
jgi:tripartite ATP-independent transporter DctM subunit